MTERDVYELEVQNARAALQSLEKSHEDLQKQVQKTTQEHHSLADMMKKDLSEAFLTAHAQYDLLKEAFKEGIEIVKEGATEYLNEEAAVMRLSFAVRNSGGDVEKYTEKLHEQAEALQRLTGTSSEQIMQVQSMALTMGVSAKETERFTEVSFALSRMMGQDVTTAARTLARAHAEGKEELKKYGIVLSNTTADGEGFARVLDEVEQRTKGFSDQIPEAQRSANELAYAWDQIKKGIGGAAIELFTFLNRDAIIARKMQSGKDQGAQLGAMGLLKMLKDKGAIPEQNDEDINGGTFQSPVIDVNKITKDMEGEQKLIDKHKEYLAKVWGDERTLRQDQEDAANKHTRDALDKVKDWEQEGADFENETMTNTLKLAMEDNDARQKIDDAYFKATEEAAKRSNERKLQEQVQFWQSLKQQAQQYGEQILDVGMNFVAKELTAHTKFNAALFDLQVQRETVGMTETQALAKRYQMEEDLRQSKVASLEAELAAALASVAKDAAVKALWEGAQAIASAASYDEVGAEQHAVAALLYAGVAVAAGGSAYAISSNRGMTADEKNQLADAKKQQEKSNEREAKQTSQRGAAEAGNTIIVNYMGIAGVSELQQAKELERIRKQFNASLTGTG